MEKTKESEKEIEGGRWRWWEEKWGGRRKPIRKLRKKGEVRGDKGGGREKQREQHSGREEV